LFAKSALLMKDYRNGIYIFNIIWYFDVFIVAVLMTASTFVFLSPVTWQDCCVCSLWLFINV